MQKTKQQQEKKFKVYFQVRQLSRFWFSNFQQENTLLA